jgi:prevent-host-death family protein
MDQIGVAQLRQNASRYLARVEGGETFTVTDRGRPVALLIPFPSDPWKRLLESGRVLRPTSDADVTDRPPADYGINASQRLAELREHER